MSSSVIVGRDAKLRIYGVSSSSAVVGRDAKLRIYGVSSSSDIVGRDAKEDLRFVAVVGCCRSRR